MADAALSFDAMIKADREKKKREQLAQQMLGSKKASAGAGTLPTRKVPNGPGASLASRVGVTKRSSSAGPKPNIDGQWTHDLHDAGSRRNSRPSSNLGNDRSSRMMAGLKKELSAPNGSTNQANIRKVPTGPSMSIRGMAAPPVQAGPYVVIASNFAPGTTAADIQAAMEPIAGEVTSCKLVSSNPTVMAELIIDEKDGADNVIATFNNQKADGRVLYVYLKSGGPTPGLHPLHNSSSQASVRAAAPAKEAAAPAPKEPEVFDLSKSDETDVMEVDEEKAAPRREPIDRPRAYADDRDRYRDDRYRGDRYQDNRYSQQRGSYDRRDGPGYGPPRAPAGRFYSDNLPRGGGDRRLRP